MRGEAYSYTSSVKSDASDELINTYVLRPAAGLLVRTLYRTPVTPNQVTLAATAAGLAAAGLYLQGTPGLTLAAGLCITLKDILDSADGQLARAKGMFSRAGRFLDSIGDFAVNLAVFAAIAAAMLAQGAGIEAPLLCLCAFLGISLRVSYHVYYQTSFLHLRSAYAGNRTSEELTEEDRGEDRKTAALHRTFLLLYGWQDRLVARIDAFAAGGAPPDAALSVRWYGDVTGVRLSGFLGLGTELFLLTACSVAGALKLYLVLNIGGMNLYWACCVAYRRRVLRPKLGAPGAA
ncbi:MAG TPA: CDP-alcohol phosphatidyltransferase family protein [Bacteroidota bacterium]|nr:CDP-alcohol phosphatidyltransferase family protein [Bacteroidota bacterium]